MSYQSALDAFAAGERETVYHYGSTVEFELEATPTETAFVGHFIVVGEENRDENTGSTVLQSLLDAARQRGLQHMELHIQPTGNDGQVDASEALLDKFGFDYQPGAIANDAIDEILVGSRPL